MILQDIIKFAVDFQPSLSAMLDNTVGINQLQEKLDPLPIGTHFFSLWNLSLVR